MTGERKFTGAHALAIFVGAFAVVVAVNLALAFAAVRSFPGLETANSYVASQSFDARRSAQERLGWEARAEVADGTLALTILDRAGAPAEIAALEATLGRPTHPRDDTVPEFAFDGRAFVAPMATGGGVWILRVKAVSSGGEPFETRLRVRAEGRGRSR